MGDADDRVDGRRLGIVVVSYGSSDLLARNLAQLDTLRRPHVIVVVDNWTSGEERRRVTEVAGVHGWRTVLSDTNEGFGGGMNRGVDVARAAGAEDLLLLNPDATISAAAIDELAAASAAQPGALLCPLIRRPDDRVWFAGLWLDEEDGRIRRADDRPRRGHPWLTGACLWIPVEAWDRIGGFDESYFLYWEDVDFSRRALEAGCELVLVEAATAVHDVGGTQGSHGGAKSSTYYVHTIANRGRYAASHLDAAGIRRWRRADVSAAWEVVMRGGRRQFLRPWRPLGALWRGMRRSRALTGDALRGRTARVYATARTAHLERDADRADVTILYGERRYDFDETAAPQLDLVQADVRGVFLHLLATPYAVIEVNEPLMLRSVARSAAAIVAVRLRAAVTGHRARVVAYCIENLEPRAEHVAGARARAAQRGRLRLSRFVWRRLDRVAFGTPGARRLYGEVYGRPGRRTRVTEIPALPAPTPVEPVRSTPPTLVFLGAFVERKGFPLLLEAWPAVAAATDARLVLIGKGEGEARARAFSDADPRVDVLIDPPRAALFEALSRATALTLPSQRQSRWREQVGLPLTEGLAAGCEIVTTTETGLAEWLQDHGHRTVPTGCTPQDLADALIDAIRGARDPAQVRADLPGHDGRLAAASWLAAAAH